MEYYAKYNSPIGEIYIVVNSEGVKRIELSEEGFKEYLGTSYIKEDMTACMYVIEQLDEYFKGTRRVFDLPMSIEGTEFRKKVWNILMKIPYGETRSYASIAESIGNPKAVRAVGGANRNNPIPIIIPCHRVIGKNGDLVGYCGDKTYIKRSLLEIEHIKI